MKQNNVYKGTLLRLGTTDLKGNMFPKDCKVTFPNVVPIKLSISDTNPSGYADIYMDNHELRCTATIDNEVLLGFDEHFVGGFYNRVKLHEDNNVKVIDSCNLVDMSIVSEEHSCDKNLKIRRNKNGNSF